jgi:hypothetical protein
VGLVIGLHGAKGSGKDEFFKIVKASFPHLDVRKIAYADPIKREVSYIFDLTSENQYDQFKRTTVSYTLPDHKPYPVEGRRVVREIGMLMRRYDQNQFTRYVEQEINNAPDAIWCVTDLRFSNEMESLRQMGAHIVKIKRGEFDGHETEMEFSDRDCDAVIHNVNITLDQYEQLVVAEMDKILQLHKAEECK